MYVQPAFAVNEHESLHALIRQRPLGTWIARNGTETTVNHVPFLLDDRRGEHGVLMAHVPRANPVWRGLSDSESIVVFHGPDAYISPSWYASKQEHDRVVPTWNYVVVQAHGVSQIIEDRDWLYTHLQKMTGTHELAIGSDWKIEDAPSDYIDNMMKALVGIEIPISRLVGKFKMNQNRSDADKAGVIAGLRQSGESRSLEVADLVNLLATKPQEKAK